MTEWLKHQPDPSKEPETDNTYALNLLESIKANHVVLSGTYNALFTKISVSQLSASIGIATRVTEPTVSIMYTGTDKHPSILSTDDLYTSALFVTISGQEYLAASSTNNIRLWNLTNNTSSAVYQFKEERDWLLCVIDDRTVFCVHTRSVWSTF